VIPAWERGSDAGVVDERVEPVVLACHLLCERAHLVEGSKVRAEPVELLVGGARADLVDRLSSASVVAAVDEECCARSSELSSERAAETVRCPCDQDRLFGNRLNGAFFSPYVFA